MSDEIKLEADDLEDGQAEEESCDCSGEQLLRNAGLTSVDEVYDAFRVKKGLISRADVCAIPAQYGVSNEELSKICGWEPERFAKYFEGEIPSKEDSQLLLSILADPQEFASRKQKAGV